MQDLRVAEHSAGLGSDRSGDRGGPRRCGVSSQALPNTIDQRFPHAARPTLCCTTPSTADSAWVKRFDAFLKLGKLALWMLAGIFAAGLVAVTFNTIRLQVVSHLDEIGIMRLVGATDAFIRRPFHYSGILLGGGAGAMALALVALLVLPLNAALDDLARLYGADLQISLMDMQTAALLLVFSATLGFLGAALSLRRNLAKID